tara:strand:+ start:351 stop:1073 length:723 start_codon:yes stop_codon:yes gene_type:complete
MNKKFTYGYYKKLLKTFLDKKMNFIFFDELDDFSDEKFILLRHDIDFDIDKALKMAILENSMSVKSTYFFLHNSEFYNLYHMDNVNKIKNLMSLGHKISLHFDPCNYGDSADKEIKEHCSKEIKYFSNLFDVEINIVSFHRPQKNVLNGQIEINNTYMPKYAKSIKYISDSMKKMHEGDFIEMASLGNHKQLQLLIHPIWWNDTETTPQQDYDNFLERKYKKITDEISKNSKIFKVDKKQ